MEPVTALGIAAAAVQFVSFASDILVGAVNIHNITSDSNKEKNEIQKITAHLKSLNAELVQNSQKSAFSGHTSDLQQLCFGCNEVADELLSTLAKLESGGRSTWKQSFIIALRTVLSDEKISALRRRLDAFSQQISMQILVSVRSEIGALHNAHSTIFTSVNETQNLVSQVLKRVDQNTQHQWSNSIRDAIHRSYANLYKDPNEVNVPSPLSSESLRQIDQFRFQRQLLEQLRFQQIHDREEHIPLAYQRTFEWIFQPPVEGQNWFSFADWIQSDDPLYWITGKAGSGKSTLMKYLLQDHRTSELFKSKNPYLLAFYFWNSGTEIQMSREGLIRTFIHQVIFDMPQLARTLLPERYEAFRLLGDRYAWDYEWGWAELRTAFRRFIQEITKERVLALFIDGLDEYSGNHSELVELVQTFIQPGVKVCLSSRPWNVFADAFSSQPHLRLEDLTFNDMKHFVESKLTANPGFRLLAELDPTNANDLVNQVSNKAAGVFLWIHLVTISLLEGLSDGERLSDLQTRLDSIPVEIEGLFMKILMSLDQWHLKRAYQLFQILNCSLQQNDSLLPWEFSFADEDDSNVYKMPRPAPSDRKLEERGQLLLRRLNACTKGLLEAKGTQQPVQYIHRTARDWIYSPEIRAKIEDGTPSSFDPYFQLLQAAIMTMKMADPQPIASFENPSRGNVDSRIRSKIEAALHYAQHWKSVNCADQSELPDELEKAISELWVIQKKYWQEEKQRLSSDPDYVPPRINMDTDYWAQSPWGLCDQRLGSMLHIAVVYKLVDYLQTKLTSLDRLTLLRLSHYTKQSLADELCTLHLHPLIYASVPLQNMEKVVCPRLLLVLVKSGADVPANISQKIKERAESTVLASNNDDWQDLAEALDNRVQGQKRKEKIKWKFWKH